MLKGPSAVFVLLDFASSQRICASLALGLVRRPARHLALLATVEDDAADVPGCTRH
jgi:hypothetical protein